MNFFSFSRFMYDDKKRIPSNDFRCSGNANTSIFPFTNPYHKNSNEHFVISYNYRIFWAHTFDFVRKTIFSSTISIANLILMKAFVTIWTPKLSLYFGFKRKTDKCVSMAMKDVWLWKNRNGHGFLALGNVCVSFRFGASYHQFLFLKYNLNVILHSMIQKWESLIIIEYSSCALIGSFLDIITFTE